MSADSDEQINERYVLESMYESDPRLLFEDQGGEGGGMFMASPHVPQPFFITRKPTDGVSGKEADLIEVQHLPPITFNFVFPWDYPSSQAPIFTLTCDWLSRQQLSKLCHRLDEIWEENKGEVILYTWFQFLESEAFDYLGITSPLDLSSVVPHSKNRHRKKPHHVSVQQNSGAENENIHTDGKLCGCSKNSHTDSQLCGNSQNLKPKEEMECDSAYSSQNSTDSSADGAVKDSEVAETHTETDSEGCDPRAKQDVVSLVDLMQRVIDYDRQKQQEEFDRSTVSCVVCFTDVPGYKCVRFVECGHAFCKQCVQGSFRVKIKEGDVKGLTCLMPDCETQAYPNQVKAVVTPEEYERYDKILLRVTLETMSDVVYCPRRLCQSAVIRESNSNMGRCPQCSFVFCTLCKLSYHGPTPCRIKSEELQKLVREYVKASDEKKQFMEKQYGKRTIQRALEEMDSAQWLEQNAKMCPYCGTQIQKKDGCNKMTCSKCRTYFCWLCNEMLSRSNPYGHYNNPNSPCNTMLFEGTEIDDNDDDDWWDEDAEDEDGYLIF